MGLPTALLHHLHALSLFSDGPDEGLDTAIAALTADLRVTVASGCGFQLTITQRGYPVVLTVADPPQPSSPEVTTSLRLPLNRIRTGFEAGSQYVFYAGSVGALVDLAADLEYALPVRSPTSHAGGADAQGRSRSTSVDDTWPPIVLDQDLPPSTREPGLTGVAELATIDRAIGVLLDRGHHSDDVDVNLRRRATAGGLTPFAWAAQLLAEAAR